MFKVGDKVRFIADDYFYIMKGDFDQPYYWKKPFEASDRLMLGGEYEIEGIEQKLFSRSYKLKNIPFLISEEGLQLSSDVKLCDFNIGEEVKFNPRCSKKEIKALKLIHPGLKIGERYKVDEIINEYYIVVILDLNLRSIPLRWIDFER